MENRRAIQERISKSGLDHTDIVWYALARCQILMITRPEVWFIKGGEKMAKNSGNGYRRGAVTQRSQTFNPRTHSWVKRDTGTGRFMDQKTSDSRPFKGVRKEG